MPEQGSGYSTKAVADILGVAPSTVRRYISDGFLPEPGWVRVGRRRQRQYSQEWVRRAFDTLSLADAAASDVRRSRTSVSGLGLAAYSPSSRTTDELEQISVDVYIGSDDEIAARRLISSVDELARALGYEGPINEHFSRGSIFRRSWWQRTASSDEVKRRLKTLEAAVEVAAYGAKQAEATERLGKAFNSVVTAIADQDRACILVGSVLVAKFRGPDGGSQLLARTLSAPELDAIERFPEIMTHPENLLVALAAAAGIVDPGEGDVPRPSITS